MEVLTLAAHCTACHGLAFWKLARKTRNLMLPPPFTCSHRRKVTNLIAKGEADTTAGGKRSGT